MGFGFILVVLLIGASYIRKLENRIKVQDARIFTMEQLLDSKLIKNVKEKGKKTAAQKAKG